MADAGAVVVAGAAVLARAVAATLGAVAARLALRLAAHAPVPGVAQALAGDGIAAFGVGRVTVARLGAVEPEVAGRTRGVARVLLEAGAAQTGAGHVVARGAVVAGALLLAALAVEAGPAGRLAEQARPAGRALAQAVRVRAVAPVLALALVRAFVAVEALRARPLAVVPHVTCT